MSAGDVPKLGCAVQGTAGGSAHEGGTLMLLQTDDGGPSVLAAEALVTGMLPQWHMRLARGPLSPLNGATATFAHHDLSRPASRTVQVNTAAWQVDRAFECSLTLLLFVTKFI
jgi:hypothetical protein